MSKEATVAGDGLSAPAEQLHPSMRHPLASLRARAGARSFALTRDAWLTLLELALILAGAAIVARPYLNFDPAVVPAGIEYLYHISPNYAWTHAQTCGLCALWNGNIGGGYPAFADVQASVLHPSVIVGTLLFGVVNGAKVALFLAFLTAGIAQWWIGRSLGLARMVRTWAGLMAVVGGHLAARMEGGIYGLVLSLAACSLAFAALVALMQRGTRRGTVLFGVTLAMALLAGQGYVQVGFAFLLPLACLLMVRNPLGGRVLGMRLLQGFALAGLLAAPLLLPALHFLPQMSKHMDPQFASGQPLRFIVLNLVVNDAAYYRTEILGKMAFPAVYAAFIGWIPFILALWGVPSRSVTGSARHGIFFAASALGALWLASAVPLALTARIVPIPAVQDFLFGVRFTPFLTGLAVPPLLALSGIGLQRLLTSPWPRLDLQVTDPSAAPATRLKLDLRWLLIVPLFWALREAYLFNRAYIVTTAVGPEVGRALDALKTPDLQWVDTPFVEWYWTESALARNLKLSLSTRPWFWDGRDVPPAVRALSREALPPPGMTLAGQVEGLSLFAAGPGREYAAVNGADGSRTVCRAEGVGGNVDVTCDASVGGTLTVMENGWPGWRATVDGQDAAITDTPWITLPVPQGRHTVSLRYRPFDAFAGIALMLFGIALALYLWLAGGRDAAPPANTPAEAAAP